jgi:hypothetical protein
MSLPAAADRFPQSFHRFVDVSLDDTADDGFDLAFLWKPRHLRHDSYDHAA